MICSSYQIVNLQELHNSLSHYLPISVFAVVAASTLLQKEIRYSILVSVHYRKFERSSVQGLAIVVGLVGGSGSYY